MPLAFVYWTIFLLWVASAIWRRRSEGSHHFQDSADRFLLAVLMFFAGWHMFGPPVQF